MLLWVNKFNPKELRPFLYIQPECKGSSSSVCGVNQETFVSECHAHDVHILVDYYSSCPARNSSKYSICIFDVFKKNFFYYQIYLVMM